MLEQTGRRPQIFSKLVTHGRFDLFTGNFPQLQILGDVDRRRLYDNYLNVVQPTTTSTSTTTHKAKRARLRTKPQRTPSDVYYKLHKIMKFISQ